MAARSPSSSSVAADQRLVAWQEKRAIAYPCLLLLAAALVLRGALGPTQLHDSLAIYWVWGDQFTAELAHGVVYPRWLPASDGGLGTPVFYYYPPLAFYATAAFGLAGLSTYASLIAAFGTAFAASGIACWHWLKGRSNHPLLGAAFFTAAPYHLLNYTHRGALAESLAIALIPLIAIGMRRVSERRGGVAFTAIAYAAMIGTHLPLALIVSLFFIAPYALLHRERVLQFGVFSATGIALAAIYLVPALALAGYHDAGQLYRTANLTTGYWSLFSDNWSDSTFTIVMIMAASIIAAAIWPAVRRRDGWAAYAIGICILVVGLIPFVWSLPFLRDVQFPFRALPLAEFALATAVAKLPRKPGPPAALIALPLLVSLMVLPGTRAPAQDLNRLKALHPDVYEYLPKGVMRPGQTGSTLAEVMAPRIPPPHVAAMVVEPHFYFPAWSCGTIEPRTQLLMHKPGCRPHIGWTMAEMVGAIISALAAAGLAGFLLLRLRTPQAGPGVA
jgi:hypothetical protein